MTAPVRTFLPWYRVGFATALSGVPAAGEGRAAVPVGVRLRGEPARGRRAGPLVLAGPGDVVGLDVREVQRTEPFDGGTDFEPAYFPYVELASPDLPWRFSPEGPASSPLPDPGAGGGGVRQRVRPWLALVAVPVDRSTLDAGPGGGTAVLRCDAGQLPDPTEAWAWAHVQVTHDPGQPLAEALATPGAARARLLCPRRLDGGVAYRAALVPTFAAGRAAVLGGNGADPLGPAWGPAGDVALPAYFTWTFRTGPEGSFESLVRRLRPRRMPAAAAGRTIAVGDPGWGAHAASEDAVVVMQGALRPLGATEPPVDPDPEIPPDTPPPPPPPPGGGGGPAPPDESPPAGGGGEGMPAPPDDLPPPVGPGDGESFAAALAVAADGGEPPAGDEVLAESLRVAVSRSGDGLELRPPLYGQDYQRGVAALAAGGEGWLHELNTDPRRRVAAGLAGWAVAVHQEDLVDAAWQQLAAGGRQQADRSLAEAVTGSLSDRHRVGPVGLPAGGALARMLRAGGPITADVSRAVADTPTVSVTAAAEPSAPEETFAPHYDRPAYELLRSLAPEWLLPAVGDIPADTITLACTNAAFIESYLVGLNHTLARELQWRRFPLQADGTFFDRFWASTGDTPGSILPPVATWDAADPLGSHTTAEDQLVLVVRGALLQRFPTAAVYLSRTGAGGAEEQLLPAFSGRIGSDCVFIGFPLTADAALDGWSVVVQEAMGHARFGVDEPPPDGTTAPLTSWQDLDGAHPHLAGRAHVPVAGALAGVRRPLAQGAPATAVWGLDAAQQAAIVQQPAFRVRIPVALWLGPLHPATP